MVPIAFDELNVFAFPHSRMRKLLNSCTSKFGHTDFSSLNDFENLLMRLQIIFNEFKAHEEIENRLVMKKLKTKLEQNSPDDDTELICNCHKKDRFTPLMTLFQDGFAFMRRGNADRMFYGVKLHKAMSSFCQDFVPHMHEEENGIQQLISKYFTEIEIKMMRTQVIKMTLQQRGNSPANTIDHIERPFKFYFITYERCTTISNLSQNLLQYIMKYLTDCEIRQSCLRINKQWNQCATTVLKTRSPISQLPEEVLLRIFKFHLNPSDLFSACIRVSRQWRHIIKDRTLWSIVNPINWARGQWNSNIPSEEMIANENYSETLKASEIRVITGFVKYFLPNYGSCIETLILYGSVTINDNIARKIFDLCPNLKHINIGMTKLTSKAFIHFRWIKSLESLILEGCELMDDSLFSNLISSLILPENFDTIAIEEKHECLLESSPLTLSNRFTLCGKCAKRHKENTKKFKLNVLNLSGCYCITDYGLNLLINNGFTEHLTYVDLSGCIRISSDCLSLLVCSSANLKPENIYFCDNISLSLLSTANCCRNVENNCGRYCCRSTF